MRILLVDVEQRFAAAVRQGLEAEGLAVDVAHDGDEGLWMAQSNDYDAIVRSTRSWRRPLASERVTAPGVGLPRGRNPDQAARSCSRSPGRRPDPGRPRVGAPGHRRT